MVRPSGPRLRGPMAQPQDDHGAAAPSESELRRRELEAARASARALQAADDVRRDIGRHLHDRVQTLAIAARQQLHVARRGLDDEPAALAEVERLLGALAGELQDVARGLHVTGLETGLRAALEELAQHSPLRLVIEDLPDVPLGASVETTIYTMVSEAINNAAKHAHATRVRVRVRANRSTLTAEVGDDGVGGADALNGSGLLGLRDRVTLLGGTLHIESPGGGGTTLRATMPVGPERLAHRPFFLLGNDDDEAFADRAVDRIVSGRKTAGLSVAREWETEGGPPQHGQLMPVVDHRGRRRLTVQVTGLRLLPFCEIGEASYRACGFEEPTLDACRHAVRAFFTAWRAAIAVLIEDPDWALAEDEPMLVLHHRIVSVDG
jgi:two-component sensor histidine kinase/uncharacterized protein YhfF